MQVKDELDRGARAQQADEAPDRTAKQTNDERNRIFTPLKGHLDRIFSPLESHLTDEERMRGFRSQILGGWNRPAQGQQTHEGLREVCFRCFLDKALDISITGAPHLILP